MSTSLQKGQRIRCAFGTGFIEAVDMDKKLVTIKLDNGETKILNPQECERVTTMGPATQTATVVTTTVAGGSGEVKTVKTVTTQSKTTTTTTTSTKQ